MFHSDFPLRPPLSPLFSLISSHNGLERGKASALADCGRECSSSTSNTLPPILPQ